MKNYDFWGPSARDRRQWRLVGKRLASAGGWRPLCRFGSCQIRAEPTTAATNYYFFFPLSARAACCKKQVLWTKSCSEWTHSVDTHSVKFYTQSRLALRIAIVLFVAYMAGMAFMAFMLLLFMAFIGVASSSWTAAVIYFIVFITFNACMGFMAFFIAALMVIIAYIGAMLLALLPWIWSTPWILWELASNNQSHHFDQ